VDLRQSGPQWISTYSGTDTLISIEQLTGSAYADTLTGNTAANRLAGGEGDDTLNGQDGDDWLDGGAGNDRLTGGPGTDTVLGGDGDDWLGGGFGNDRQEGGAGNDVFAGNPSGNDVLDGGTGEDRADYSDSSDAVRVDLRQSGPQWISTDSGTDTLISIEQLTGSAYADTLTGNTAANRLAGGEGDDTLNGQDGDDWLDGGAGNDWLGGGSGNDILTGGTGVDTFVFDTVPTISNIDVITDFNHAEDVIALSSAIFTAFAGHEGERVGQNANLFYNNFSGTLYYDADGSQPGSAEAFAILGQDTHPVTFDTVLIIA